MALKSIGSIKIIDVHKRDLLSGTVKLLEENYMVWEDKNSEIEEHIVGVSKFLDEDFETVSWMISFDVIDQMKELQKLLEEYDAQYIRLVTI